MSSARYGRPDPRARRAGIVVVALVVVALLAWLVWAALAQSKGGVGGLVESYDVTSPHQVSVTLAMTSPHGAAVSCTVTALATDHAPVGQRIVSLPAGRSGTRQLTTTVRTERAATTVTVGHCHET